MAFCKNFTYNGRCLNGSTYFVEGSNVPLRRTPENTGTIITRLNAGDEVEHTGKESDDFYEVTYGDNTGWVKSESLTKKFVYKDLIVVGMDFTGTTDTGILSRTVNRSPLTYDESIAYDYGVVDSDVFSFSLTISRDLVYHFTQAEIREIVSWLMSPTEPQWLSMEVCEDIRDIHQIVRNVDFKGRFVNVSYTESPGYYKEALTFTFESISPYGYTPVWTWSFHNEDREPTRYIVRDVDIPGTKVGKLISPVVLIRSLGNKVADAIELEDRSEYITSQTNAEDSMVLESDTPIDTKQVISIRDYSANTETFRIRIPNGTCVAIMDDNCYYYDAGEDDPTVDYITEEFDPSKITGLYNFENIDNFNWPKLFAGTNDFKFTGIAKIQYFARFYEALGV